MRKPAVRVSRFLLGLLLILGHGGAAAHGQAAETAEQRLAAGLPVEGELAGGETRSWRLDAPPGRSLLVSVDQTSIDVALELTAPDGRSEGEIDAVRERRRSEVALLSAGPAGPAGSPATWRVTVRSTQPGATPGRYRLAAEALPEGTPLEAWRLMTVAGRLATARTEASRREALPLYEQAAQLFQGAGLQVEEAQALLHAAILHRALGDARQALPLLERTLPLWAPLGHPVEESDALTLIGMAHLTLSENEKALASLRRALDLRQAAGDVEREALIRNNIGLVLHTRGEWAEALTQYEAALRLWIATGDRELEAVGRTNVAGVWDLLGEPLKALEENEKALALARALANRPFEARILHNLGALHASLGRLSEALFCYNQALALFRETGDRFWQARALNNRGSAYRLLGEPRRAAADFEEALALRRAVEDRRGEALTLGNLGLARQDLGEPAAALALFAQSRELARAAGDRRAEAAALLDLGRGRLAGNDPSGALAMLTEAAALLRELGDRQLLAEVLQRMGEAHARSEGAAWGDPAQALPLLAESLSLRRLLEDRLGEAVTLAAQARIEQRRGLLPAAREHAAAALEIVESLRAEVVNPDLRATFFGSRQEIFELAIGLAESGEAAFTLSERARARSLLDLLDQARVEVRRGVDPHLRERDKELAARLAAKARKRAELPTGEAGETRRTAMDREIHEILQQLDDVRTEIRRTSPGYAALSQPQPAALGEIQEILEPGVLLLETSLGVERSFLWAVTRTSFETFSLPGRAEIESLARQAVESWRTVEVGGGVAGGSGEAAAALSRLLLGPVAHRLSGATRLEIVTEGALLFLPFSALPAPDPGAGPLLTAHEVVVLPSAAVLAAGLRRAPRTSRGIAVVADPVFTAEDPRLRSLPNGPGAPATPGRTEDAPALQELRGRALQRLPESLREARGIETLAGPGGASLFLGTAASRDAILSGELAPYRILHFATHGLIDSESPELSGLMLSLFDQDGRPREGFLGLADIYNLEIGADLVVLSGCDTALGREVRGEGLLGLARGFLHAGARQVLATLWRVEDRAAAELMTRFYRALLEHGLPPAAALRQAQLSLRSERRFRHPYHWAAFILIGEDGREAAITDQPATVRQGKDRTPGPIH
jgi:CHAT domain-containing protein/tetratricopeptide (TPR) repeat protein